MCCDGCACLKDEFKLRNFLMNHEDPSKFVRLQCFSPMYYVAWVLFSWLWFFSLVVLEVIYHDDQGTNYFAFLTNITFTLTCITVTLDLIITIYVHLRRKDIIDGLATTTPWYMQVNWILYNIVLPTSFFVTIGYYLSGSNIEWTHGSVNLHILNSVYTLLLLNLTAKPVRLLHVYQVMIFALLYTLFSLAYNLAGHDPIYGAEEFLDWENKTTRTVILSVLTVFVFCPLLHSFCFGLYKLGVFVANKCKCNSSSRVSPMGSGKPMAMA